MTAPALRLLRSTLVEAVAPEPLVATLQSLIHNGLIEGYEEAPPHILIWGNLTAVEAALENLEHQQAGRHEEDVCADITSARVEYFSRARAYMSTLSFARLPKISRDIWRMHANGAKYPEIILKLRVSTQAVRVALRGARLAAGLPKAMVTMQARGGGRPPDPREKPCKVEGCTAEKHKGNGFCNIHYLRWWKGKLEPEHADAREGVPTQACR